MVLQDFLCGPCSWCWLSSPPSSPIWSSLTSRWTGSQSIGFILIGLSDANDRSPIKNLRVSFFTLFFFFFFSLGFWLMTETFFFFFPGAAICYRHRLNVVSIGYHRYQPHLNNMADQDGRWSTWHTWRPVQPIRLCIALSVFDWVLLLGVI